MAKAERFDNAIFRDRYKLLEQKEKLPLSEVAERLGFTARDKRTGCLKPDSSRVARMLGMAKDNGKYRETVSYNNAVALCDALHIDYIDAGV